MNRDLSDKRSKHVGLFPSVQAELHKDSKHKKKKKKKHKKRHSSSSSSSSDGDQWVEKPSAASVAPEKPSSPAAVPAAASTAPPKDDWADLESIFSGGVTSGETRQQRRQTKQQAREEEERRRQQQLEALQWRDTGETGAPRPAARVGDGGAGWLRRALERARQQAATSGQPLEEVVAERWGSMEKLQEMLDAAEQRTGAGRAAAAAREQPQGREKEKRGWRRRSPERRRSRSAERRRSRSRERRLSRSRERRRSRSRSRSRSRRRSREKRRMRKQSKSPDRQRGGRADRGRSRSRSNERRRSKERRRSRSRSRERERSRSGSRDRRRSRSRERRRDKSNERRKNRSKDRSRSRSRERRRSVSVEKGDISAKVVRSGTADGAKRAAEHAKSPSPGSRSASGEERKSEEPPARPLSDAEMNALAARVLKAELNGDEDEVATLQAQLEAARRLRAEGGPARGAPRADREKVVVVVDAKSGARPPTERPAKRRKADTQRGGEREKYFADDDRLGLKEMFERERLSSAADAAASLDRLAAAGGARQPRHALDDHGLDEQLAERAGRAEPERAHDERLAARARAQHRTQERCHRCLDNRQTLKHLIAALGERCYLALPAGRSLTERHCLIVPQQHAASLVALDEDAWAEVGRFRTALVAMFAAEDRDVLFFETALKLRQHPHAVLHCVPVPREEGDLAPIYFKKALEESETEWSQNKKVVDLKGRDVRRAIPKGLPYFFVDFGLQPGFAHVVEDENVFPDNFAQEIIGGMLELDPSSWRRSKNESLDEQRKKVMEFCKVWGPHDFTRDK